MYRIELHKGINQIVSNFQHFAIWVEDGASLSSKVLVILQFLFYASTPIALASGAIKTDDKLDSVFLASAAIIVSVQVVRLFYIIWKKSEILDFLRQCCYHVVEDNEEFVRVNKKVNILMKIGTFMILDVAFSVCGVFSYDAILREKELPFHIGFPLDWKNSEFGYWIAFAYLVIQCTYSCVFVSLNVIIWYIMLNFSIQYELLGNQLSRMGSGIITRTEISNKKKEFLFIQEFITIIHFHQHIRLQIEQFQSCFSKLIFIQVGTGGFGTCTALYTLVFMSQEDFSQAPVHVMILLYNIFDIFMLTYIANEIKLQSQRLSYCLFECDWVEQSNSCKKLIVIVVENLKQPHELVIAKLYPLNLETFTSIINFSYSMFNVLKNFN